MNRADKLGTMLYCYVTRDMCLCSYFNNDDNDNDDNNDNYDNYAYNYNAASHMYVHSAAVTKR